MVPAQPWLRDLARSARQVAPALGIFLSVGVLVAAWAAAGVLALLVVVGLDLVSPRAFLPGAALATALVAFATGTSWGTVATVGVALMGVARGVGVPAAAAAGAVVAGAHFGDKLSPLSETATLAAAVAGTDLYTHLRHTAYTTVPAFAASLGLYLALGQPPAPPGPGAGAADLRAALAGAYHLTPALWLPVLVVLAAALLRWPVVPSLLGSAALALALAVGVQGYPLYRVPALVWWGYQPQTGHAQADAILAQGGIWPMGRLAAVAVGLFLAVLAAVRSRSGQRLMAWVAARARTPARAVALAVFTALALMAASGSSYLTIVVTGELLRDAFRRAGLAPENLSRTLEDSGTVVAPLVPWGVSGLFMARTLGVPTAEYAPYAVLNYGGFLLALLYGCTGWFLRRTGSGRGGGA